MPELSGHDVVGLRQGRALGFGGWFVVLVVLALLAACARPPAPPLVKVLPPEVEKPEVVQPEVSPLQAVSWDEVRGWQDDNPALALGSFLKGCKALRWRSEWQEVCQAAREFEGRPEAEVRKFFEQAFVPHRMHKPDGSTRGLITGYYVPDLRGSRQATADYAYPLYVRPEDLLTIDLGDIYPELGKYRLRGRLDGHRVIPYWDRTEIDGHQQPLAGQELFWVNDPVELFFLHIQGSGRIMLEDGSRVMVNYADQNGHPYRSIGKWLIDHGEMTRDQMSMQNIRAWARDNPQEVENLLGENPSYVFFRELDSSFDSPPGALGVPLTPGRSLAVDPRHISLGTPVFLSTSWPNSSKPLNRLMVAQDTGGAIKGPIRGDFFWGMGDQAGSQAGRMKQPAWMWVLLPANGEGKP